jgi:thiol-disulfide isomerase/thioredoxin
LIPAATVLPADPPDAASLVQGVIDLENKVHDFDSILIRVNGTWTQTPRAMELRRRETNEELGKREIPADRQTELLATWTETDELIFDARRIRIRNASPVMCGTISVWDGEVAKSRSEYVPRNQVHCAISDKCEFFDHVPCLGWLQAGHHRFWWANREVWSGYGSPREFQHAGQTVYRGRECYVLKNAERATMYVGVEDRRLHGQVNYVRDRGQGKLRPQFEHFADDYREVVPGFWLPWVHGYKIFDVDDEEVCERSTRELTITEAQVNPKLADDLFDLELPEEAMTTDWRYNPPLQYRYKKDRTETEFQEMIAKRDASLALGQKILAEQDQRLAALMGEPATEFPETAWLNSEPLRWASLKGRVVILDFFSESCGPCRGDLPVLNRLHAERDKSGITVIGLHAAGSDLETIREFAKKFQIAYPVCIDVKQKSAGLAFGDVSSWYGVRGIPHSVLIDANGKIAGHGMLRNMVVMARALVAKGS